MAAADDEPRHMDQTERRAEHAAGSPTADTDLERDGGTDRATTSVKANIDRVADKVKHLLGSDR